MLFFNSFNDVSSINCLIYTSSGSVPHLIHLTMNYVKEWFFMFVLHYCCISMFLKYRLIIKSY